ncbi:oligosaccharide repeat unit polymerase [Dasania marina]|uniref:oligosaccharide repeat unit polymerase n=1 Tax=Dasania marina TaxID=471499 RepID=UPI000360748D|nr:oligosaccharide repeat unit polymerase [Dasania marina]
MDSYLFYPYLIIFILLLAYDISIAKRISVSTLVVVVVVFIILLPSSQHDDGWLWRFALLGVVASVFIEYLFLARWAKSKSYYFNDNDNVNCNITILGVAGLLVYSWHAMSLIIESGGFIDALIRARVDQYLTEGVLESSFFKAVSYILLPFTIITIGDYHLRGKIKNFYIAMSIMCLYLLMVAETRLPLLFLILTPVYIWFFKLKVIKRYIAFFVMGPIGLLLFILYVNLGALLRSGVAYGLSLEKLLSNSSFVEQMGYRAWISDVVRYVDVHGIDYGWQWTAAPWLNFIPRFIWEGKPITSTSNRLHEEVGGMILGDGNYITTYTIFGEGYHQLGYLGVALSPIILVGLYYTCYRLVRSIRGSEFFMVWMLFRFIPFIRAEQPFFMVMVFAAEIFLIKLISRFKWI